MRDKRNKYKYINLFNNSYERKIFRKKKYFWKRCCKDIIFKNIWLFKQENIIYV